MNIITYSKQALFMFLLLFTLIGCSSQGEDKATAETNNADNKKTEDIVGIIGPMKEEIALLHEDMKVESEEKVAGMTFYEGTLNGQDIVLVQSGIGKVNAAMAAQLLVTQFEADKLINSGISGALHPDVALGDIVISKDTVHHDMDETAKGLEPGVIPRMEESYFKADEQLISLAQEAAKKLDDDVQVFTERIATGDQFIADEEKKQWILDTFNAYVVEMEGAAVGQVAHLNDVPYIVIRSASDDAGEEAYVKWEDFKQDAIENSSFIIKNMLKNME